MQCRAMVLGGCLLLLLAVQCGRTQLVGDNVQHRPGARVEEIMHAMVIHRYGDMNGCIDGCAGRSPAVRAV